MRARAKRLAFGALLALFTVTASALAAELLVRAVYGDRLVLFPRYVTGVDYEGFRIRRNVPNAVYRHTSPDGRWTFRINAEGFRSDVDTPYEKPAGTLRVLAVGDSFTVGYEVAREETYAAVLERTLRARGVTAEVVNAGVSGFGNAEELVFFEHEGLRYHPDVVVVGFYANDLVDNVRADLYRLDGDALVLNRRDYQPAIGARDVLNSFAVYRWASEHSYAQNFLSNLATVWLKRRMLDRNLSAVTDEHSTADSFSPEARAYAETLACRLLEELHRVAARHAVRFVLLDIPTRDGLVRSLPARCAAETLADRWVDGGAVLRAHTAPGETLYWPHGDNHWTPTSHRVVGTYLADVVQDAVATATGG